MARHPFLIASLTAVLALGSSAAGLAARDLGNYGQVWAVSEPDFLEEILGRLRAMEEDGGLARMEREMQDRARAYAERPRGNDLLTRAEEPRRFTVDLSIRLDQDLADQNGTVFAAAGTTVNPLAYSTFDKAILFIDGDDPDQVAWATAQGSELDTLIVLTRGAPLELMRRNGRRFWFDQDGIMTQRFSIARLPSRVTRADPVMLVEEIPLPRHGKAEQ